MHLFTSVSHIHNKFPNYFNCSTVK